MRMIGVAACIGLVVGIRTVQGQNEAPPPVPVPDRSPATAAWLGAFVPGAGHFYAGESLRGAGLFFITAGGIAEGLYLYNMSPCTYSPLFTCDSAAARRAQHIYGIEAVAVGSVAWVISAIDAPRAVRRRLEHQRLGTAQLEWRPRLGLTRAQPRQFTIGVQGTW